MKQFIFGLSAAIITLGFTAHSNKHNPEPERSAARSPLNQSTNNMNSYVAIFEIPATDISRAIKFYESILDIGIEKMEIPGMEMGILPYENQVVTGIIIKGEGYQPSADGIAIYLNAGDDLQVVLDKVEKNGGSILVPKTAHADESGFFALFLDSEGNRLGLNSPN
ncbi:MAG: VOC family protein [Balneolales bacterium]|nr:VOC family protein [Balneolales bacterium]